MPPKRKRVAINPPDEAVEPAGEPEAAADNKTKLPNTRVSFTFPMLQDLIFLVLEHKPWQAAHGKVRATWQGIADNMNTQYNLTPPTTLKEAAVRNKIKDLRKMHENGEELTRPSLSGDQQTVLASMLDKLCTQLNAQDKEEADASEAKKQKLDKQEVDGARARHNAVTRVSERAPPPPPPPNANTSSSRSAEKRRTASAPPLQPTHTIPDIISTLSSTINFAEGRQTQRLEVLQSEQVRATRDGTNMAKRSALALERLASAAEGLLAVFGTLQPTIARPEEEEGLEE
ncbi:hypothetical protein FRC07_004789 [Ceratobasidium sp. 392]|nr:hypothetical protein FRC07_004789 [Ceratobasidium sp. 392]